MVEVFVYFVCQGFQVVVFGFVFIGVVDVFEQVCVNYGDGKVVVVVLVLLKIFVEFLVEIVVIVKLGQVVGDVELGQGIVGVGQFVIQVVQFVILVEQQGGVKQGNGQDLLDYVVVY